MRAFRVGGLVLGTVAGIVILAIALRDPSQVPPYAYVLFVLVMAAGLLTHWTVHRGRQST